MRDTCDEIYRNQYKQLRKLFILLCLESHDRYCFNILRMITLLYNLYIEHVIYNMSNNKKINHINDHLFIKIQRVSVMSLLHLIKNLVM